MRAVAAVCAAATLLVFPLWCGRSAAGAGEGPAATPLATNPLLSEDAAGREGARREGQLIYQRSCRPCHGMLGAGDGPYARTFAAPATDLLMAGGAPGAPGRMFDRIKRGATALPEAERSGAAMPAFGDALSDRQIWSVLLVLDDTRALLGRRASSVDAAALYEARCSVCHGAGGAGDGPIAAELFPRPRDFTRAGYRFRSTESGASPQPTDLVRTLERGLGDTAMGSFAPLGEPALARLAGRLKTFSPERFAAPARVVASAPAEPAADAAILARGRTLYDDLSCGQCHGKDGRGDGPADLKDDAGNASRPANLTKRWQLKGGASAADLFRTISTGLNGTPMPSYVDSTEPDDRWALVQYVASLGRPRPEFVSEVRAARAPAALPRDPEAPFWQGLARVAVPLGPQMAEEPRWGSPAIDVVEIAVAVSAGEIGFLLVWDDRTRDVTNDDAGAPRDHTIDAGRVGRWRLADQIALEIPSARWIWSATSATPGASAMRIERTSPSAPAVEAKERTGGDGRSGLLGIFGRKKTEGAGGAMRVSSTANFAFGRWRMLVIAARHPSDASPGGFPAGGMVPFSIQAWDGGAGEIGSRHGLSSSITLVLPGE